MPFTPASQAPTRPAKVGDPGNLELLQRIVDALAELRGAGLLIGNDLGSGGGGGTTPAEVNALIEKAMPSPALAKLKAQMTLRSARACKIVFVGSSTTEGRNASVASRRWVNLLVGMMQAAYPNASGTESAVLANVDLAWGTIPTSKGIHGLNGGHGGKTAADYLTASERNIVVNAAPAAVIHMVGSNDFATGVSVATYKSNLSGVLNDLKNRCPAACVQILVQPYRRGDANAYTNSAAAGTTWEMFAQAQRELAEADPDRVAFIDLTEMYDQIGLTGQNPPDPLDVLDTDLVHQNDAGHAYMAELMATALGVPHLASSSAPAGAPVAPTISITPGDGQYTVNQVAAGSDWTSLELFTSTSNSGDLTGGTVRDTQLPSVRTGAVNGTTYYAQVRVTGPGGTAVSSIVSGTPAAAGGGTPTYFLNDTFADTDGKSIYSHTSDSGHTWSRHPSITTSDTPQILSNQLRFGDVNSSHRIVSSVTPPSANYKVEFDITYLTVPAASTDAGANSGIGIRYTKTGTVRTGYYLFFPTSAVGWRLDKLVSDTNTPGLISGGTSFKIPTAGQTLHVILEANGSTLKVTIDGSVMGTVTDTSITDANGIVIIGGVTDTSTTGARIDNLTATAL